MELHGINQRTLDAMTHGKSKESRALRDFVLNLSNPQAYEFTLQRFGDMSEGDFEIALRILRSVRSHAIAPENLDQVAAHIESGIDQSNACLEMIGETSIRIVVARKHVGRVSTKHIGQANALKKARWIRDNYLYVAKGKSKVRRPPTIRKGGVKGISLISDLRAGRFVFSAKLQSSTGRPASKQFNIIDLGFEGAFREALAKLKEQASDVDDQMPNPFQPTQEEYTRFKQLVPDLPEPGESLK